jgi:hypothetical protein
MEILVDLTRLYCIAPAAQRGGSQRDPRYSALDAGRRHKTNNPRLACLGSGDARRRT